MTGRVPHSVDLVNGGADASKKGDTGLIHGSFIVIPYGIQESVPLVSFDIGSSPAGNLHHYAIQFHGRSGAMTLKGTVPKNKSGHGNIFHLLRAIMDDIDLSGVSADFTSIRGAS